MRRVLFAFALALCLATVPAHGDELAQQQSANRLLRSELEQARKGQIYFSFDLAQREILIKASGVTLARLPVTEVRSWGVAPTETIRILSQKSARKEPRREQIVVQKEGETPPPAPAPAPTPPPSPAAPGKTAIELQALELSDMPRDYELRFDDGLLLTVHGVDAEQPSLWERARWYLSRPLISDWHFFKGKPYTEMRLVMPLREARMLYWTSSEGAVCLFPHAQP